VTEEPTEFDGIFLIRGMRLRIPEGALTISMDDSGELSPSLSAVHVGHDLHVHWLEVAQGHLKQAMEAHSQLLDAWTR